MTKKFTCIFILISSLVNAQSPQAKKWDYRYGGSNAEIVTGFVQTADGGFVLYGHSSSPANGDRSQPTQGGFDYWIVKLDSNGVKEWDKDFGGNNDDLLYSLTVTKDGGYLLGGTSYSGTSGDKTDSLRGAQDYWILKTDSAGNKLWDKTFGGNNIDWMYSCVQTADSGFIIGGYSYSDSSGEKSSANKGQKDYWIVRTDKEGNLVWEKSYGSTGDDWFYVIKHTADDNYILGGFSNSDSSGDKSQNTWGLYDCWIIKIDTAGNKIWDKDYGGTSIDGLYALITTNDGGFIFGGPSISGVGGNKTQPSWGAYDYWVIKTDKDGNYEWDADFGGTGNEEVFGNIFQTNDNGYMISGLSYSGIGGNKTENNLGAEQSWVVKTDSMGNFQWDKTIFTTGHDEAGFCAQSTDGCSVFVNFTSAGTGGYKTQPSWNNTDDYWIVKFCDSVPNAVEAILPDNQIKILPNPITDYMTIKWNDNNISRSTEINIQLKNILGEVIQVEQVENPSDNYHIMHLSHISNGVYFIDIKIGEKHYLKKLIKQ